MARQTWVFINSSPEGFQIGVALLFQARGYRVIGCDEAPDGLILVLRRGQALHVAYCLRSLLAVSSVDTAACRQATERYVAAHRYVVTRSSFLPGAVIEAWTAGTELVDGATLHEWLKMRERMV